MKSFATLGSFFPQVSKRVLLAFSVLTWVGAAVVAMRPVALDASEQTATTFVETAKVQSFAAERIPMLVAMEPGDELHVRVIESGCVWGHETRLVIDHDRVRVDVESDITSGPPLFFPFGWRALDTKLREQADRLLRRMLLSEPNDCIDSEWLLMAIVRDGVVLDGGKLHADVCHGSQFLKALGVSDLANRGVAPAEPVKVVENNELILQKLGDPGFMGSSNDTCHS